MNRRQEALLYLLRAGRSPEIIRELSNLAPNSSPISALNAEDWALVVKEANRHGLSPYLFHKFRISSPAPAGPLAAATPAPKLDPVPPALIPDSVLSDLRQAYLLNVAVNLQRFHYLGIALRTLAEARVPVIVLKGGYLAEAVYGNIALRVMCDIDILVRRENVAAAAEALRSSGYDPQEHSLDPPLDANEFHFIHRKSRAMIELHWELIRSEYPYELNPDSIWPAAVAARIAGIDTLALSPEDLLCHLAVHAGVHSFNNGLKAFVDCAEAIDRLPVDWPCLVARARLFRAVRPVWLYLLLARRLLGAAVPDSVFAELRPSGVSEAIVASAIERILPTEGDPSSRDAGNPNLILLFGRKGIRAKLALAFHRAFPSRASIASLYSVGPNSPRLFLYYPKWIWDLIKRNAPAIRARLSFWRNNEKEDDAGGTANRRGGHAALMDWLIRAE